MQYPIIDLITSAYINNGWTGLELTPSKNLLDNDKSLWGLYATDATGYVQLPSSNPTRFSPYLINIEVNPGDIFTLSIHNNMTGATFLFGINIYNESSNRIYDSGWQASPYTFTCPDNSSILRMPFRLSNNVDVRPYLNVLGTAFNIQLEKGNTATSYEPYQLPDTDIANRLKLPLPHYFPHPVIDALQRAAAGTQTADDTEILRHYLTPLGIGGI